MVHAPLITGSRGSSTENVVKENKQYSPCGSLMRSLGSHGQQPEDTTRWGSHDSQHTGDTSSSRSRSAGSRSSPGIGDPGHLLRGSRCSWRAAIQRATEGDPGGDRKQSEPPSSGRGDTLNSSRDVWRMAHVLRFRLASGLRAVARARHGSSTAKCSWLVR